MTACFADEKDAVERGEGTRVPGRECCWRDVLERLAHKWSTISRRTRKDCGHRCLMGEPDKILMAPISP